MKKENDEKELSYVTRTVEEDLLVVSTTPNPPILTLARYIVIILMSLIILGVYLVMNHMFYPQYPVINTFAEKSEVFSEQYPPFRMNENISGTIAGEIISGNIRNEDSSARKHSIGYPLLAALLTAKYGDIGLYYTNAFILWLSALVFFTFMIQVVRFRIAVVFTIIFAFATPNLFFASSAYCEPLSQLLTLLSFLFLLKGLLSYREYFYYSICGVSIGLNMFVQPFMALTVVLFAVIIFAERSRRSWKDKGVVLLFAGHSFSLLIFYIINKILFGGLPENIFLNLTYLHYQSTGLSAGYGGNVLVGIWKLLFDSPHGLMFVMPITMVFPLGTIIMWRKKLRSLSVIGGAVVLYVIIYTALSCCPISGEVVGARPLLPIIPLIIIPIAFLWEEELGERIWLGVTLLLTIYMCSFGWWTGTVREKGLLIGVLQDRDARYIILARKNMLDKPAFSSNGETVEMFFDSLKKSDIGQWLQTLDRTSIDEIRDFERMIFNALVQKVQSQNYTEEDFIESVDPENGIRLIIPEIDSVSD
ncbi:hypothetical protein ACFL2X_01695 [Candidatus Latescibacterota bacterium]